MTIANETNKSGPYYGNGVTTAFEYDFKIDDAAHIRVFSLVGSIESELVLNTDYSVTGIGNANGGSVIISVAPAISASITLIRNVPFTQELDLQNQGAYYAEAVERAFDLSVARDQQLKEELGRTVKVPVSSDPTDLETLIGGVIELLGIAGDVSTVADIAGSVTAVAGISGDVSTVAGIATAVAGISGDVSTVAGIATAVSTVADSAADVSTVASIAGNVSTVADLKDEIEAILDVVGGSVPRFATRATLKTRVPQTGDVVYLAENRIAGHFVWLVGDYSYQVSIDPTEGIWIKANSVAVTSGIWSRRIDSSVNVLWFGADRFGVANSTAAITAADVTARALRWQLFFPSGTYLVSQLVVYPYADWLGEGMNSTTIKQIIGSNTDLIYGVNSNANWGLAIPANTNYAHSFSIDGLTLDGNWNGGPAYPGGTPGNTSGSGFVVYGDHCVIQNLYIKNCAEHGMRTEMQADHNTSYDQRFLEATYAFIRVDYVGKHGWLNRGPHDMVVTDCTSLDAGQLATNTYCGFVFQSGSSGRQIGIHAATRNGRNRMAVAVQIDDGASHEFSGGCNIEGGNNANLLLASSGCSFDPSTRFYAAWNGVNIYLGGNAKRNTIKGMLQGAPAGRPACAGIVFGGGAGDNVADNDIDVYAVDQNAGVVSFSTGDKGGNTIKIRGYNTANVGIVGTKNAGTVLDIKMKVNGGSPFEIDSLNQTTLLASVPAGGSSVWTFPFPFRTAPIIGLAYAGPTTAPTGPLWWSALSATSVTVFNGSSAAQPVHVIAKGAY